MAKSKEKDIAAEYPGLVVIHQRVQGQDIADHFHDEHEFFFPLHGEIHIRLGQRVLKAGPGKIIYVPPKTAHSFSANTSLQGERLIAIFSPLLWKKYEGAVCSAGILPASQLCIEVLYHMLIHPQSKTTKALSETLVRTLSEILAETPSSVAGVQHLSGKIKDARIRKVLEHLEENFQAPLSMEALAKQSGISVRNFNRLFLIETGFTPKQVIAQYRIQLARKLLRTGRKSVTDIAFEVGYNSVSQFIATFRKHTGEIPTTYRSK